MPLLKAKSYLSGSIYNIKLIEILSVKNIMSIRSCRYKMKCHNISRTSFFSINGNAYYEFIDKNLIMMLRDIKCKSYVWYMDTVKRFENIEQNIKISHN